MAQTQKGKTSKKKTRKAKIQKTAGTTDRLRMIEEAAYLKAEKEAFQGDPMQYWLAAETEIEVMLAKKRR